MPDVLADASAWLDCKRTEFMSIAVNYSRGADSVNVAGTVGKTVFEVSQNFGIIEKVEARDYLILTSDLVLAGVAILPKGGDRIREMQGAFVYVYEVMAPNNEPVYRFSDAYRKTLRIHTKMIATEDAPT